MNPSDCYEIRKICIRLSMEMGTGLDYFMSLPVSTLLLTVKDYVEVMEKINEQRRRMAKK